MPVFQLTQKIVFPPTHLAEHDGLLAVGGDLSPERLLEAYRRGIFPWYGEGDPILWWSPAPRLVLFPEEFHISKRLSRIIRKGIFTVTADTSFQEVIRNCAAKRSQERRETWITKDMIEAYKCLHKLGYAHSIECWKDGHLAGGLYGIALDHVFFGESMFSDVTNSSKVALFHLVQHASQTGINLIDCQVKTEHLVRFGAREISRARFQELLAKNIQKPAKQKKWRLQMDQQGGS